MWSKCLYSATNPDLPIYTANTDMDIIRSKKEDLDKFLAEDSKEGYCY
jgi:hypothetical protein